MGVVLVILGMWLNFPGIFTSLSDILSGADILIRRKRDVLWKEISFFKKGRFMKFEPKSSSKPKIHFYGLFGISNT